MYCHTKWLFVWKTSGYRIKTCTIFFNTIVMPVLKQSNDSILRKPGIINWKCFERLHLARQQYLNDE